MKDQSGLLSCLVWFESHQSGIEIGFRCAFRFPRGEFESHQSGIEMLKGEAPPKVENGV